MMPVERLTVWAERLEGFVAVGTLEFDEGGNEQFEYDANYLASDSAAPIFPILPLQAGRFAVAQTRPAFASLGPEGVVGHDIRIALRAGREAIAQVLARLNHETVGALAFGARDENLNDNLVEPKPLDLSFFEELAHNPERVALDTLLESRLSLNGAVSKIGVIQQNGTWYLPQGLAPSTHIIKAGSSAFPNQMLNEALCMRCALSCGFDDTAETGLIVIDGAEPLITSKRFDRIELNGRRMGLSTVMRLHQADFCQILGTWTDALKYTPADELVESYTTSMSEAISHESSARYGDRVYLFNMLAFDYLIGNCDNHLKNFSMTWSPDWKSKSLSPLYDITCTTVYEDLTRDMGMGIGRHRRIDAVEVSDFPLMAQQLGVGWRQVCDDLAEMAESIIDSLYVAAHDLETEFGVPAVSFAEALAKNCRGRVDTALGASLLRG